MIDVEHQQRQRRVVGARGLDGGDQRAIEMFAVAEAGEGIGQALGADRVEAFLQMADFLLGADQALFQRPVVLDGIVGGVQQRVDHHAQFVAAFR